MRTHHTNHILPSFPVYSAAFVTDDRLVLGGGGGSSRSGVKNKLRIYKVPNDATLEEVSELQLEKDEDAPMSIAADVEGARVVCGINSSTEEIQKGINKNCRLLDVSKDRLSLLESVSTLNITPETMDDCQKVTVFSHGHTLVAVAGLRNLSVLAYPSLAEAAQPVDTDDDIYDASFTATSLILATTKNLFVYAIPPAAAPDTNSGVQTRSKKKVRHQPNLRSSAPSLELLRTIERPVLPGADSEGSTFRVCRVNPAVENTMYTVSNTVPARSKGKSKVKQGFVSRWDTSTWEMCKVSKVGEKGITCFDISPNGKFIAFGSADQTIGILDAQTLAPLLNILKAHDFPPTVIRFNPSSSMLVSGSADNSVRVVTVPDGLSGTTWTIGQIILIIFALLGPILLGILAAGRY